VKESLASEPLQVDKAIQKTRKAGVTAGNKEIVKKEQRKVAGSKLHDPKQSDASPQRPPEPQKKKRKTQRDQTATSDSARALSRTQEKPLGKPKAPREKKKTDKS
jgi:hypothetical protein